MRKKVETINHFLISRNIITPINVGTNILPNEKKRARNAWFGLVIKVEKNMTKQLARSANTVNLIMCFILSVYSIESKVLQISDEIVALIYFYTVFYSAI